MTIESPVLTAIEAADWLRLTEDHADPGAAVAAVHRLVQEGRLFPLRVGKSYKFTLGELERFASELDVSTPSTPPDRPDASVTTTSGESAHQSAHQRRIADTIVRDGNGRFTRGAAR